MAKRKCRMTAEEIDVHKRAVALRKMTDLQELTDGSVKGVGKVTTEKLIEYCLEKGYSKFGMREV